MTTKPRRFDPEYYYHIYNCGVERRNLFTSRRDYQRFLGTMQFYVHNQTISYMQFQELSQASKTSYFQLNPKGLETMRVKIIAYCLMPNHFHLLLKPTNQTGITKFISDITNSHTRYFNVKNKRIGRFVQGTFKSKEISGDSSLLQVSRYIHLNPVFSSKTNAEGQLKRPEDYPYSSYAEWLGLMKDHTLADRGEVTSWLKLAGGPEEYRQFVEAKIASNPALGIEDLVFEPKP